METQAIVRGVRLSCDKGRLVADMVRGKKVDQALNILTFTPKIGYPDKWRDYSALVLVGVLLCGGCGKSDSGGNARPPSTPSAKKLTIGVAFETLQTEYCVAGFEAIKAELKKRDIAMLEAVADQDASRP